MKFVQGNPVTETDLVSNRDVCRVCDPDEVIWGGMSFTKVVDIVECFSTKAAFYPMRGILF